jgi:hypothetical protein
MDSSLKRQFSPPIGRAERHVWAEGGQNSDGLAAESFMKSLLTVRSTEMTSSDQRPLPAGWTGWVDEHSMIESMKGKPRPFCRGRCVQHGGPWFPRSSKPPAEGIRWAVYSPQRQLPLFDREGWFIVSRYLTRPCDFVPEVTRVCGCLDDAVVDELHRKLQQFFWDQRRFRGAEASGVTFSRSDSTSKA